MVNLNKPHDVSENSLPIIENLFNWPSSSLQIPSSYTIFSNGEKEVSKEDYVTVVRKSSSSSKKSTNCDLDLTGSPLKASFCLDEDEDEDDLEVVSICRKPIGPSFVPLPTRKGRKLISDIDKRQNSTAFAVCDNTYNTLFLGSSKSSKEGLTMFKVQNLGFVTQKENGSLFQNILGEHQGLDNKISVFARAIYNMSEPISSEVVNDHNSSSLMLRFHWTKPQNLLETPPGYANVELLSKLSFEDDRLACFPMFQEIELLARFKEGLNNQGISWMKKQEDDPDLMEELRNLLIRVKQNGPRSSLKVGQKPDLSHVETSTDDVEAMNVAQRQDVDLTDMLWDVLKRVESFQELKQSWEFIFLTIKREEIRPYINARNATKLAKVVQRIVRNEDVDFNDLIDGANALEMLFEIGVEKLKRDYTFTVLNHLLATRGELEKLLQNPNEIVVLKKLHCIQCLVFLCQTFLSPQHGCLRSIVQQAIKVLSVESEIESKKEMVFNISGSQIKDQINALCPSIWQAFVNVEGPQIDIKTTLHLSVDPPTDTVQAKENLPTIKEDDEDDVPNHHKVEYFALKALAITRKELHD